MIVVPEGQGQTPAETGTTVEVDDRALKETQNWASHSHRQLYDSVHNGNDPGQAGALASEWNAIGSEIMDSSEQLSARLRATESGWQGETASVARNAIQDLVQWSGTAGQTATELGDRVADQGRIAENARAAMPEPVEFDWQSMLVQGFATGGLAGFAMAANDVQVKSAEANAAHQQAVNVMTGMENESRAVDVAVPRFTPPPDPMAGNGEGVASLRSGMLTEGTTAREPRAEAGMRAVMPAAGQGAEGRSAATQQLPAGVPAAAAGGPGSAPAMPQIPAASDGTGASGFAPGGGQPGPGGAGFGPAGGPGGGAPPAFNPPNTTTPAGMPPLAAGAGPGGVMPGVGGFRPNTTTPQGVSGPQNAGMPGVPGGFPRGEDQARNSPPRMPPIPPGQGVPSGPIGGPRAAGNPAPGGQPAPRQGIPGIPGSGVRPGGAGSFPPQGPGARPFPMPNTPGGSPVMPRLNVPGGPGGGGFGPGGFGGAGGSAGAGPAGDFGPRGSGPATGAAPGMGRPPVEGPMAGRGPGGAPGVGGVGGGMPMGGMGAGRGQGGDDESRRARFVEGEQIFETGADSLPPSVIGGKQPKKQAPQ